MITLEVVAAVVTLGFVMGAVFGFTASAVLMVCAPLWRRWRPEVEA